MKSKMKLWVGSLAVVCALGLASLSAGQDFPTLKGNNARTGKNATPAISNPGQGFITWWRPNANDAIGGTVIRNNTAASMAFSSVAWLNAPIIDGAAFHYDQPSTGNAAADLEIGAQTNNPAYRFTSTVASAPGNNPIAGSTESVTWHMNPALPPTSDPTARNYALYVWLPAGGTGTGLARQYPQRYFVYEVNYGNGATRSFTDVVDTYAAGPGWVRLGNGGRTTNRLFAYDGAAPIRITLYNTVPRYSDTGTLTDAPGTTVVYADAARAVPQIGEMRATPTVANIAGGTRTVAAYNQKSVGERNGDTVNISSGVVTSYDYNNGARRWTFRPGEQAFTYTLDDLSAGASASPGFGTVTIGAGTATGRGTTYRRATIAAGGTEGVIYTTASGSESVLEDGTYQVQIYIAPSVVGETHGNSVKIFVREAGVDIPVYVDLDRGPGWYPIGGRRFANTQANPLRVEITNDSNLAGDVGKFSYAESVRFIGAFDAEVNSTPTTARINVRQPGGAMVAQDVVFVACEDGRIYCLDAVGNADGTTNVIWAYPSIPDTANPTWVDPNLTAGIDGTSGPGGSTTIAEMPVGFGMTSPIVQNIAGTDYVFIAARNGRVYCIDASGRGDFDFGAGRAGTTSRIWSFPSDFPSSRRAGTLGSFTFSSVAYAAVGGVPRLYVGTESGHMYALNPVGNVGTRTTNILWDFPGSNQNLPAITTTPAIDFGRIYFGTAEDDSGAGRFYSLDATTGAAATAQVFTTTAGLPTPLAFVGGPATATAAQIGGAAPVDTIFVANQNRNIYALNAANINNVIWRTEELNTTVIGALSFTPMNVFDRTGVRNVLPLVMVPGANGHIAGLFARGGLTNDSSNIFNGKLAWGYQAADEIVAGTSVGGPAGLPGFMYTGDLSGYLYAFSNTPNGGGDGDPPGFEELPPNDPDAQIWLNGKIKVVDKATYNLLRNEPTTLSRNDINDIVNTPPYAFEWGQTIYFVVYDFPYRKGRDGSASTTASLVNFQISTDGATTRQFAVVARQCTAPTDDQDGYAVLAFAIQGSGPNSLPPGRGKVSYSITPGQSTGGARVIVSQNPNNGLDFQVANPLAIKMTATGLNDSIGYTTVTNDPGALANGSPDLPGTGANNESLLTSTFGLIGHAQTGNTTVYVYDRSAMVLLRGPNRGLDQVRVQRPELEWLGGPAAIVKPIDTGIFGTLFEDLPDQRPNISLDYPNIRAENVNVVKDPNGTAENPGFSGVSLVAPRHPSAGGVLDDDNIATRLLQPTPFEINVDIPRFQPANNSTDWTNSAGATIPSGYSGRFRVFVDSNTDGILDTIGGRTEANRTFWLNGSVAVNENVVVRTPNVDLGALPAGAGYTTAFPGTGGAFTPWGPTSDYTQMFKEFVVENPGNVNLLNLRIAKWTQVPGSGRLAWPMYSAGVDDNAWLDAGIGLWSDIDETFMRPGRPAILQKARVGERGSTILQTNPVIRENANLDTNGGRFSLTEPHSDNPRIAVSIPIGFPVGTYSEQIRVIEDRYTGSNYLTGDEALNFDALNPTRPVEAYSDPTMTVSFKVIESRFSNDFSKLTASMADNPFTLGSRTAGFLHKNLQPTAARTTTGNLVAAWTSTRDRDIAGQPLQASGNDQYRIYVTGLNGNGALPAQHDPGNGLKDLGSFAPGSAVQWFRPSPTTANGYPAPGYLYPSSAGESIVAGTERYGAPSLPVKGYQNTFEPALASGDPTVFNNLDMAFVGDAMKLTSSGRVTESRLFMTRLTVDVNGLPTLDATPYPMPYDPNTQKGKPSVVKLDGNRSLAFYSALGTGNSNIFWTLFDYNQRTNATTGGYTVPATLDFGDGFESVGSPSATGRRYIGVTGAKPVIDLSFTGKLRGRSNNEVFLGRIEANGAGIPQQLMNFPESFREKISPDRETGLFRVRGVEWDRAERIVLEMRDAAGVYTNIVNPTTPPQVDRQTGLIVADTTLGGKAYLDPRLGTVRLTNGSPLSTSTLHLTYTSKFKRVSTGTAAGHTGVSMAFDNRVDGVRPPNFTRYWAQSGGGSIGSGDRPQVNRMFFTYNRAAAGAGQTARPFMKTMRLGIQLPYQIYTDASGNLVGLNVTGATGYYQVDPVKGRIYFSPSDEDKTITVRYQSLDQTSGAALGPFTYEANVTWIDEMDEGPVPVEQAVNESNMFLFPDPNPFQVAALPRPNLVWMFWTSTRGGSPDIFFQTMAPRFAPQARGK